MNIKTNNHQKAIKNQDEFCFSQRVGCLRQRLQSTFKKKSRRNPLGAGMEKEEEKGDWKNCF